MRSTSEHDLKDNLADRLDEVTDDSVPLLITRERGRPPAVLMSLKDFASYEETQHLLKNPRNAERLLKAIEELDAGATDRAHELLE